MKLTTPMLQYYWQRSCSVVNFIASKLSDLNLFPAKLFLPSSGTDSCCQVPRQQVTSPARQQVTSRWRDSFGVAALTPTFTTSPNRPIPDPRFTLTDHPKRDGCQGESEIKDWSVRSNLDGCDWQVYYFGVAKALQESKQFERAVFVGSSAGAV